MALVIKYLSQPHAGREITIPDDQDEVKFGRAADADIGFPPELDIVSRDHFRLRREVGAYKFIISRELPVFSGGRPLLDGEELDAVTDIQLSGPTGPKLRIEQMGESASNLPRTRVLARGQDIGDFADATRKGGRRLAGWLGAVTVVAALVAGGYFVLQQDVSALKAEIPSISDQIAKTAQAAAGRVDMAAIIGRNKESVYQIQLRKPGGDVAGSGTASVIQLPDGRKALATNAHVAAMFFSVKQDPAMAGYKVVAVQPKAPDYPALEITDAQIHPFYLEHRQLTERLLGLAGSGAAQAIKPMNGYDVGLMFVADPAQLGEPLTYGSREAIKAIRTGDPLVLIGYPAEGLRGTDERRPEPTSQTGIITSMTTFYLNHASDEDDQLIQHSVPATGGASGSPMLNAAGEVVGFLYSGNVADVAKSGARMPSAALVNYAIRADLLLDMLDGTAESKIAGYRAQAVEAEARYIKSPEAYIADLVSDFGMGVAGDPRAVVTVATEEILLDQVLPGAPNGRYGAREITMEPTMVYLILAVASDKRPIGMTVLQNGEQFIARGPNNSHLSFAVVNNVKLRLPKALWAVMDVDSILNDRAPDTPAKVTVHIYKALPRAKDGS